MEIKWWNWIELLKLIPPFEFICKNIDILRGTHIQKWQGCTYQCIKSRSHQWQFFCKKGVIERQFQKRGIIGCELAQNLGNLTHFFWIFQKLLRFAKFFEIWWFCRKILIAKAKIGGHWVLSCEKRGIRSQTNAEKGVYWQGHDI